MQKIIYILLLTFSFGLLHAQEIPERPNPPRLINDFYGLLPKDQVQQLESALVQFNQETSTQITVVIVKDLGGTSVEDYAFKLGQKWGVGQKGKNNGVVMIIKPKVGNERGQAFIATGYGVEGVLPDAIANQIVDREMIPQFKQGDYYKGIAIGVTRIMDITRGEYTAESYSNNKATKGSGIVGLLIFFIMITFVVRMLSASRKSHLSGKSLPFWLLLSMMGSSNHSSRSGSWGGFSGGSGGFGGRGGGFGGFGGGGFGGGGAGGSW